ncbi:hypothetical protein [Aurantimonas sp. Leaf443]|uniref:hypothetical protein n=1 Tax=Aurantimonas sp. Leaf443 TaxID=1736378 RepID=UPI0006FD1AB3|nr:hypothetical protein [Aurantimonas sp. Leaf443]KQT88243.1 hypothetical protein ASG48_02065 [Aurantimonas sp. Leaf443]
MDDVKAWYRSKTIWGAIVALGASLAGLAGLAIDPAGQETLVSALADIGVALGAILAVVGRIRAQKAIG